MALYDYVSNSPLALVDPSGLESEEKKNSEAKEQPRLTVKNNAEFVIRQRRQIRVALDVKHIDQHEVEKQQGLRRDTGCHATCVVAITNYTGKAPQEHGRIQVAIPGTEDSHGRFATDKKAAWEAINHIDDSLNRGQPVEVGVSFKRFTPGYNNDRITDHWVVIRGRTYDEEGRVVYSFMDPGGADSNFYVDFSSRKLYREGANPSSGWTGQADYLVTQVRKTE